MDMLENLKRFLKNKLKNINYIDVDYSKKFREYTIFLNDINININFDFQYDYSKNNEYNYNRLIQIITYELYNNFIKE